MSCELTEKELRIAKSALTRVLRNWRSEPVSVFIARVPDICATHRHHHDGLNHETVATRWRSCKPLCAKLFLLLGKHRIDIAQFIAYYYTMYLHTGVVFWYFNTGACFCTTKNGIITSILL